MQKKILAAVVASMVAGQAMAVTVIDNGTTKAEIGGYLDLRAADNGNDAGWGHQNDSSRINFAFEHKLTEATTAFAKTEWALDTESNSDDSDFIGHRLSYVGVANEQLGSISYGKQWSTYGTVAGWTDAFAAAPAGGGASGYYGYQAEALGTSRADDALQYNHSIMGLNISAQTQIGERALKKDGVSLDQARDGSYAIAASYDLPMGLSIGAAYNQAEVEDTATVANPDNNFKAKSAVLGAKFEADKLYVAFTYADLKDSAEIEKTKAHKATGIELYGSYQLNEMFAVEGGYVQLKGEDNNGVDLKAELKALPLAVVYTQGPVQLSATYEFNKGQDQSEVDTDDKMVLQARYYF